MSFFQAACSLSDFAFISWKRSRYLKTIRWFFGWSFCVFLSTGFTLTESSDLSFAIVASSLLFWDGELGRLLNFGIRLRSSGNKFLTISISRNSFYCLGFSEDSKGSTCQPYFRLFAICPTLPEYLLLGVKTLYHAPTLLFGFELQTDLQLCRWHDERGLILLNLPFPNSAVLYGVVFCVGRMASLDESFCNCLTTLFSSMCLQL